MRENPGSHSHSLSVYGFNCTQLNIAPRADRFELYAGIGIIPGVSRHRGLVRLHCMLHLLNRLTVILLLKGLALKHQIFCCRQLYHFKPLGNFARTSRSQFYTLYILRSSGPAVIIGQPQAYRFTTDRPDAAQDPQTSHPTSSQYAK